MTISVNYGFKLTTRETLTSGVPDVTSPIVTHNGYDESAVLNATSTPAATKCAFFLLTLSAGAATIDLTSLTGAGGSTVDGTALKVRAIRIKPLGANDMVFTKGASNGYQLSASSWTKQVRTGGFWQEYFNDAAPAIGGSAKTIDVTGTGSQTAEVSIILG